jgi:hypothetical protein
MTKNIYIRVCISDVRTFVITSHLSGQMDTCNFQGTWRKIQRNAEVAA